MLLRCGLFAHAASDGIADLGLTPGLHTLLERVHDVHDLWSLTLRRDGYLGGTLLHPCLHKLVDGLGIFVW